MLGEESIRGSTDNLLQLYELIAAIPASLIAKLGIASSSHAHLAHILEHTPRGNKMRAMTISQLYKNTGKSSDKILHNNIGLIMKKIGGKKQNENEMK